LLKPRPASAAQSATARVVGQRIEVVNHGPRIRTIREPVDVPNVETEDPLERLPIEMARELPVTPRGAQVLTDRFALPAVEEPHAEQQKRERGQQSR